MSDIVCIQTFPNRMAAEFAQNALLEEGIQAHVSGDASGWMPYLAAGEGGVKLYVMEQDAERAEQLLSRSLRESDESGGSDPESGDAMKG